MNNQLKLNDFNSLFKKYRKKNLKFKYPLLDDAFSNWLYYVDEIVIGTLRKDHEDVREKITSSKY